MHSVSRMSLPFQSEGDDVSVYMNRGVSINNDGVCVCVCVSRTMTHTHTHTLAHTRLSDHMCTTQTSRNCHSDIHNTHPFLIRAIKACGENT